MKKIWNWIKNIFKPIRQESHIVLSEEIEETAKQKKIRLKHQGDKK
jgi:hypothetical protein